MAQSRAVGKETLTQKLQRLICLPGLLRSGPRVFCDYACTCVIVFGHTGSKFNARIEALLPFIRDPLRTPSIELLAALFPKPVKKLREVAGRDASEDVVWGIANVQKMWREHKGDVRHCDTRSGVVTALTDFGALVETGNSRHTVPVFNTLRFPITVGDGVYFHKSVIAEVVEAVTLSEFLAQ